MAPVQVCQRVGCLPLTVPALAGMAAFGGCAHPAAGHAYTAHAGLVLLGMASAVSLLIRHWRSIEAAATPAGELHKDAALLDEPLLVSGASSPRDMQLQTECRQEAVIRSMRCAACRRMMRMTCLRVGRR